VPDNTTLVWKPSRHKMVLSIWMTRIFMLMLTITETVTYAFCPFFTCVTYITYSTRLIETAYGSIRGIILPRGRNFVDDVEAFLGVPYASPPVASLRFMPPLTPSHWEGTRVANKYGPACPQLLPDLTNRTEALANMPLLKFTQFLEMSQVVGNQSEDCLYLNIFMPKSGEQ